MKDLKNGESQEGPHSGRVREAKKRLLSLMDWVEC